jgi:DNA polymerase III subunit delta
MQIAGNQLNHHLQRGLKSLYTLHGDEPLLQQEALDTIRATARAQGFTERTSHTVAGAHFDWSEVLAAGGSLSLFADKQIVEIRIPSGKPGKDGSTALQQLADISQGNDSTLTIVLLPRLDKMTKSTAWFAALESMGVTLQVEPVERAALPQWLAQRLGAQGQRVAAGEQGQRTLQFFADRVEGNLLAAHQEIQKLALLFPVVPWNRSKVLFSMWRGTMFLNSAKLCWRGTRNGCSACWTVFKPRARPRFWCTTPLAKIYGRSSV